MTPRHQTVFSSRAPTITAMVRCAFFLSLSFGIPLATIPPSLATAQPATHTPSVNSPIFNPFADLSPAPSTVTPSAVTPPPSPEPWWWRNTLFRKELFSQVVARDVVSSPLHSDHQWYSRQSIGFEWFRRFQSATSTIASCDLQMRVVRRDHYLPVIQDMEGSDRVPWAIEYHNAYCDIFNPASFLLSAQKASSLVGALNARIGRFYLPLGLNLATDTHGTILQLSNDQNLGFERDWYAGFWGNLGTYLTYDAYYLAGSGYDLRFNGQSGLLGVRLGTSAWVKNRWGLETGWAAMVGERLASHQTGNQMSFSSDGIVRTLRVGPDLRYVLPTENGSFTLTNEGSIGSDDGRDLFIHLHQVGYLANSRRFGVNVQLRQQWMDSTSPTSTPDKHHPRPTMTTANSSDMNMDRAANSVSRSLFYDFSYYLSNDLANSNLHWINLSVEQILESPSRGSGSIISLQYYRYW